MKLIPRPYQLKVLEMLPVNVKAILIRGNLSSAERRELEQIEHYTPTNDGDYDPTNAFLAEVKPTNHLMQTVTTNGYKTGGYDVSKEISMGRATYSFTITNEEPANDFRFEGVILLDADNNLLPFAIEVLDEFTNVINREVTITITVS